MVWTSVSLWPLKHFIRSVSCKSALVFVLSSAYKRFIKHPQFCIIQYAIFIYFLLNQQLSMQNLCVHKFNQERLKATLLGVELSLDTVEDLLRSWQWPQGPLARSPLVLLPNLHWRAEGFMFTFSQMKTKKIKAVSRCPHVGISRLHCLPSHMLSWFLPRQGGLAPISDSVS